LKAELKAETEGAQPLPSKEKNYASVNSTLKCNTELCGNAGVDLSADVSIRNIPKQLG
jgi:hypothetical protein